MSMKAIRTLLLLTLPLLLSGGCMTDYCVKHANGTAGKKVLIESYRDHIIRNDGTNCLLERTYINGTTNHIRLHLITPDSGYEPKPAYYALLPLTVPADVVTFPFQFIYAYFHLPVCGASGAWSR
jgi:hypothetical protein